MVNDGVPSGLLHAIGLLLYKIDTVWGAVHVEDCCCTKSSCLFIPQHPEAVTKADEQALTALMRAVQQHWLAASQGGQSPSSLGASACCAAPQAT